MANIIITKVQFTILKYTLFIRHWSVSLVKRLDKTQCEVSLKIHSVFNIVNSPLVLCHYYTILYHSSSLTNTY